MTDSKTLSAARERFSAFLRDRRMRQTAERFAILEHALNRSGHFTADAIFNEMDRSGYHVSLSTVYTTFQLLTEAGLLRKHLFAGNAAEYERVAGSTSHTHLVCSQCGRVREIKDQQLADAIEHRRYPGLATAFFTLSVYGICTKCQRQNHKKKV